MALQRNMFALLLMSSSIVASGNSAWTMSRLPTEMIEPTDFKKVAIPAPDALEDGEVQFHTEYASIDASNRIWIDGSADSQGWTFFKSMQKAPGDTMLTYGAILRVTASKDPTFKVGDFAKAVSLVTEDFKGKPADMTGLSKIEKIPGTSLRRHLDILGVPTGLTALMAIKNISPPKPGQVVLVTAASGAVGIIVGQIYKIFGCTVIGSTGSDEKVEVLKNYGFDHAFNYKTNSYSAALSKYAPEGFDTVFENVGGPTLEAIIPHMKRHGTIIMCGAVSQYNTQKDKKYGIKNLERVVDLSLTLKGFIVADYAEQFVEGLEQLGKWMTEGKLKIEETLFSWDQFGEAQKALQTGDGKIGKVIVRGTSTNKDEL